MPIANLFMRFVLELGAAAAAGYSGYASVADAGPVRWLVGIGAALSLILLWAAVAAPKTQNGLSPLRKERIGTAIMLATAGMLALAGQPTVALGFVIVIVLNVALLGVLGRHALDQLMGVTP